MNNLSGQNLGIRASSGYKAIDVVEEGEYTMFGDLRLPSLPSQWSVQQVMAWASQNEATPEILGLIEHEKLDGRTFLLSIVDDFMFPSLGHRIRFRNALDSLRKINDETLARLEETAPPYATSSAA
ncbi:hypothetical protein BCR33DRAFT_810327 [Rhizoclosmatium globosum]|uniref:SAM domain-containing protein n=1 Tax=Rhizoclosmatium globosum TaxID=329046 RepID=A0A1Y2CI34_9FUNG|nr:hypothetical protein BCR33DRAFT_810327 [Rhizoclosmatium globosum]|eukprot:ORY46484.1 hypothetical protein BCR33DRAFT_810327 [Rhizoclosmatium globosum]